MFPHMNMLTAETHAPMLTQCLVEVNKNSVSRKKSGSTHWEIPFLVLARDTITSQNLIIHFFAPLHCLSSGRLREVKNKGNFQTFSSKSGRSHLRKVVRLQELAPNAVI